MPKVSNILSATQPSSGWYRQSQLIPAIVPFPPTTLWRKVRDGSFPKPVKLSDKITAWRASDVDAWLKEREEA